LSTMYFCFLYDANSPKYSSPFVSSTKLNIKCVEPVGALETTLPQSINLLGNFCSNAAFNCHTPSLMLIAPSLIAGTNESFNLFVKFGIFVLLY
jgi:hypothetical protein